MSSKSAEKKTTVPYVGVAIVAGAAFGIVALVNAPGIAYAIVAIVAGLCYSLITVVNRRRD
jgi:hypothetical protein